jgi:hypothetical protein
LVEVADINIHIHVHDETERKLDEIIFRLRRLDRLEREVIMDLTDLQNAVSANTDVVNSAVTLIGGLADQIEAAAGDPAAVAQLAQNLRTNNDALAAAVAANTPAAPPAGGESTGV